MTSAPSTRIHYHLPGLFEFYDFYRLFLPLYRQHPEYFFDDCDIASLYGAPADCLWGGGRTGDSTARARDVLLLTREYGISARLTFSNSLLREEHLSDARCNTLCDLFSRSPDPQNGVIVHSDLLLSYLQTRYPALYLVSSTTKVLTDFDDLTAELNREAFRFVVPDFRLNKAFDHLTALTPAQKAKVEFLCNECCWTGCTDRRICYENVSRRILGEPCAEHRCRAPHGREGYRFSLAQQNPAFISPDDIRSTYLPLGFHHFKIEGRGLGSALLLEFILTYMARPEYHIHIREALYLDPMLDLF